MKTKCSFIVAALVLTICLSTAWTQNIDFASIQIQTIKVADGLYVLMGGPAQGNILASIGSDGVFLIDSMYAPMHPKIMDALAKLSSQPVRYVVNTHLHGDHTAGNEAMAKLGAVIISHDNMRKRMAAQQNNVPPSAALPTITYTDDLTLYFNGEEIYIYHPAPAHTDGDSIIYFRHANVMHVGDIPASLRYPNIGVTDGGTVDGMIAAAQQVMKIANTETKIIPGHLGPVVGFKEIRQQLDMFAAVRDRIDVAIRAGKTLEQVVASKPTVDFDAGRLGGAITPDRFVTLVYTDRAQLAAGAEAYRSKCASCHGADAKGTAAGGNLTRLWAAGAVDQQIYQIIRRGIPNTLKPHSFGPEPQVAQIVTYLRTLSIDNSNNRRLANSENGARLFRENCSSCHQINGRGGRLGPDLSKVGAARSGGLLAHKIRNASSYIFSVYAGGYVLEGYQPVTVVMRSGERIRGIKKNEDAFSIQIMDTQERLQGYLKSSLRELINDEVSIMPDFGPARLSETDLDDLVAYLGTLR